MGMVVGSSPNCGSLKTTQVRSKVAFSRTICLAAARTNHRIDAQIRFSF